jgi:mono/diheme cytochrome c family protein/glucose/arabinose dehydrogenase
MTARRPEVLKAFGLAVVAAVALVTVLVAQERQSSPASRPWPPAVQNVGDQSPVLSPGEALKTFYMPPGYHLELVASEPLVQDPIAMDWDADGRLWVLEMPGFVKNLDVPEPNLDPIGRVVVLEDTNHDGTMDKRTVFADGLVLARAMAVLDHGVLVGEPPDLWLLNDTNGDLHADAKERVGTGYGRREGRVEQNANGLYWALDNRIYTSNSDIDLRWKDGAFEVRRTLSRGEWGVTSDDAGHIYRNTNESPVHVDLVPTAYFARNPNLDSTRGSYQAIGDADARTVWPVRPTPGTNRAYQFGIDRPDGTLARFTSACAPLVYRGDALPSDVYGNVFVAEPAANLVSRFIVRDDGTGLVAHKAYDRGEFLASTDERFRPVFLSNAPDGTLYIVDMYRGIIQQRADITQYLHDQILKRNLQDPTGLGRIYRVVHDTTRPGARPSLSTASPSQLVGLLSRPSGWWGDTAQRLLVERHAVAVVPTLTTDATDAKDVRVRLHALWTLDGLDSVTPAVVIHALGDESRDVRVSAIRIAERWLTDGGSPVVAAVLERIDDPDWNVQEQLAASLGALPSGPREAALARLLDKHADNGVVLDAALSGVRGSEGVLLDRLLESPAESAPRAIAITTLSAAIVRGAQDASVQKLFARIADTHLPSWQRSALVRGGEVVLLGLPVSGAGGAGRRGAANAGANAPATPCPTCPGGRAGPGGDYFFPQVPSRGGRGAGPGGAAGMTAAEYDAFELSGVAGGGGRGRGRGGAVLRLNSEPVAFSHLASTPDEFGGRVSKLLDRIEWPGKAGAGSAAPALTAAEQRRFDAGREVYENICQTCHQPDGRGQDKLAANLVGSWLALAPAEIPARIVLGGKDGPIGLMPPVGQTLSDEQIADVLTYVRHEWGQTGTPVDPATVAAVRASTTGRTRPWTNAELLPLLVDRRPAR